jgi:hypothetical protein
LESLGFLAGRKSWGDTQCFTRTVEGALSTTVITCECEKIPEFALKHSLKLASISEKEFLEHLQQTSPDGHAREEE